MGSENTLGETQKTIGEMALESQAAIVVFERFGIDYGCCGGETLALAAEKAGVSLTEILAAWEEMKNLLPPEPATDWRDHTLAELIWYIVDFHHGFTRRQINRLAELVEKLICSRHEECAFEMDEVKICLQKIESELLQHQAKEENHLFPYILSLEMARNQRVSWLAMPEAGMGQPMRGMMFEHDHAGELLQEMRRLTCNYTPPEDASIGFQMLYAGLQDLEADLRQHIHLENNLLFPRAIELEAEVIIPPTL